MLQWSLSNHHMFAQVTSKSNWRIPWIHDVSNLINICPTNPVQVLNLHEIFQRFCLCTWNDIFDMNKTVIVGTGARGKDGKYLRNKANIGNPKVNRGWPSLTANHILADCMEITLGPSIKHIQLGVFWGFQRDVKLRYIFMISFTTIHMCKLNVSEEMKLLDLYLSNQCLWKNCTACYREQIFLHTYCPGI